jgi:hypothetical protein
MGRRLEPELIHERRERHASEAGELRQALNSLHVERLQLGHKAELLGVLFRRDRLVLELVAQLLQPVAQLGRQPRLMWARSADSSAGNAGALRRAWSASTWDTKRSSSTMPS